MKAIFVLPASNCKSLVSSGFTTPLGIIVLASKVRENGFEAIAVNGDMLGQEMTIRFIEEQVVGDYKSLFLGLTCTAGNVQNCAELTKHFGSRGAIVALGGPNASVFGARLLKTWPNATFVVKGPAESKIVKLLQGKWRECPGVIYNSQVAIIETKDLPTRFDFNTPLYYSCLYPSIEKHKGATVVFSLDCAQAVTGRCVFCARPCFGMGHRYSKLFWNDIEWLFSYGIKFFYHAADSATIGGTENRAGRYLTKLVKHQLSNLRGQITHRLFANSREMYKPTIEELLKLGKIVVHVGFESGALLSTVGKNKTTLEDNERTIKLCQQHGIELIISFVLGLPGETTETMATTAQYILRLSERYGLVDKGGIIKYFEISPLMILPGARAADDLWKKLNLPTKGLLSPIHLDFAKASEIYCERFCSVTRKQILDQIRLLSAQCGHIDVKGITDHEM